jgi:DNA-binding XRE family transcriptional regulator
MDYFSTCQQTRLKQTHSVILHGRHNKSNSKCVYSDVPVVNTGCMPNQTQKSGAQLLFASNMKRIRLEKKLTQENVAEAAGLHPNYISSVERGERNISIANIERISCALGVSMVELVVEPEKKRKLRGATA